jgi:hypothetical protein
MSVTDSERTEKLRGDLIDDERIEREAETPKEHPSAELIRRIRGVKEKARSGMDWNEDGARECPPEGDDLDQPGRHGHNADEDEECEEDERD